MNEPKKVFLADDEIDILDILTLMLKTKGYEVMATTNPKTVFDIEEHNLPDIILLDIWMTGQDGRDICKQLKSNPATQNIPVIFISANSNIDEITSECNAQGYIAKPFEMAEMLSMIEKTLSQSSMAS
jgi:DNA-binding response OmpR family regulator